MDPCNLLLTCTRRINTCHYFRKPPSLSKHFCKLMSLTSSAKWDLLGKRASALHRLSLLINLSSFARQRGTPLIPCRCIGDVFSSNIFEWSKVSVANALVRSCCQVRKKKRLEENWDNYEVSLKITKQHSTRLKFSWLTNTWTQVLLPLFNSTFWKIGIYIKLF